MKTKDKRSEVSARARASKSGKSNIVTANLHHAGKDLKLHPALKAFFGHCLYRCAMRYREQFNKYLLQFDVNAPLVSILKIVEHTGPSSQNDLGRYLDVDKATMVKLIDHLEKSNFIERKPDPNDRRINFVSITKAGRGLLERIHDGAYAEEEIFLGPLSKTERTQLHQLLVRILDHAEIKQN